jgi:hypothetical protein
MGETLLCSKCGWEGPTTTEYDKNCVRHHLCAECGTELEGDYEAKRTSWPPRGRVPRKGKKHPSLGQYEGDLSDI